MTHQNGDCRRDALDGRPSLVRFLRALRERDPGVLRGVKPRSHKAGIQVKVRCPNHDDRNASMTVYHDGQKINPHCFTGCDRDAIMAAVGLTWRDRYDDRHGTRRAAPSPRPAVAPLPRLPEDTPDIWLICDECGLPINPDEGYLWIKLSEIKAHSDAMAEARREEERTGCTPLAMLFNVKPARWHCVHQVCDTERDALDFYHIDARRFRTWPQVIDWTAHLSTKPWIGNTDWTRLLSECATGTGRVEHARPVVTEFLDRALTVWREAVATRRTDRHRNDDLAALEHDSCFHEVLAEVYALARQHAYRRAA